MTATTFGSVRAESTESRRFPLAPAEGWTTLGLVVLLCLTLAWSIDDASWVVGPHGLTDFLPLVTILAVSWGFISAKTGWSRWLAHLLGATFAALLVPMIVGAKLPGVDGGPVAWFQATAAHCVDAYLDLTSRGLQFTTQIGHFLLVLGLIAWASGQYAGYVTFHHRRPLNAVILVGVGLVINMGLTPRDQLPYLVIYSLAALFLLIRFHAYDERLLWLRHRIGDAASLGSLYLRGGAVFVSGAVILALLLTSSASSAPLASLWKGFDQQLLDFGQEFQKVFRGGGQTRITGINFSGQAVISGLWTTDPTPVFDVTVPDNGQYYWRAVVYDRFDGLSWSWSDSSESDVGANAAVLTATSDDPSRLRARQSLQFKVTELNFSPRPIFAPDAPVSVDVPSQLTTVAINDAPTTPVYFGELNADASQYTVTASVPIVYSTEHPEGVSENQLRVAGTDYPTGITGLYLAYDPALIGPATRKLNEAILARYPDASKDPYDLARSINNYLTTDGGFSYKADVRDIDCGGNIVECFAIHKQGYCEYYASTMAMLLRFNGVPARVAYGFLPSKPDASGVERILKSSSHSWVEVYFPGFGWQRFDPTGGGIGQDVPLPAGPHVSAAPATPRGSLLPDDQGELRRSIRPQTGAGAGTVNGSGGPGSGPFIVIGVLLAIAMGALAFIAWQRGPRSASEPEAVWRSIVGLAGRLGFAPRPSQTVFEYSSSLGEILPNARPDLQLVARAKVEVAYGRGQLRDDRLRTLRDAQRRLRVALLGLLFRRRERQERRGKRR